MMPHTKPAYDPVSLAPLSFWEKTPQQREEQFRVLRDERPVSWHPPAEGSMMPPENDGFWAVVRNEDIVAVSKDPATFCSGQGVILEEVPEDILDAAQSFLAMDNPKHARLRRLVSSAFTPRQLARTEQQIHDQARQIVDRLIEIGDCDFDDQVARQLPMWTIYDMVGLPSSERDAATNAADGMVSWADEDVAAGREPTEVLTDSLMTLINVAVDLAETRRADPQDDLMTNLVQAEVDGERLTDEEIGAFFVLLSVAGNDTTRNTTSHAMKALTDFPDQRKLLIEDFDARAGTAVEEFVRWASPVMTFRRTATKDTELAGQSIAAGDWVVMFYSSGNRDERVFDQPHTFDVLRDPNPHVGFGGGGAHFCMGAMLARTQLRALFGQLLRRVPDIEAGEPTYLVGNFMNGIKQMPCTLNL